MNLTKQALKEQGVGPVRVRLLGGFGISVGHRNVPKEAWSLRKAASLIKLLTLSQGHALHREQIMDTLWPNLSKRAASNNLRQALHAARTAFHPDPQLSARVLASHKERIVLCPEGEVRADTEAFEEAARGARRAKEPSAYEVAIDLYAGELLPEDRYEEWAEGPRAHLRGLYLSLLFELASLYEERGDFGQAETVLGKLLAEEPANEEAHASLMRLYALEGRSAEALAQYRRLEEMLLRNLGMEPSASVRALREEISCGRYPPPLEVSHKPGTEGVITSPNNNLPTPRTSFVGREREMVEIKRELAMTRLLTLTGAGGSGKTRLALEIARDLAGTYSEGVWFVDLAPLSEPQLVPQAVAASLEAQEQPGRPLTETLLEALHSKNLLLVLDNCEHLIEAVGTLVDLLLTRCPGLRALATSREPLGVEGEVLWQVPTLSVPEPGRPLKLEELRGYESSRLFLQRARARSSSFATSAEDAVAVAEICRHLEGLPLAIELAAARVGVLSVSQISGMLGDELRLLNSGSRTATARHQTLRGALDWSYALLSEPERVLFGRLSVFAGSFTLEAAEAVCRGEAIEQEDVLDLLGRLVDKSLVVARVAEKGILYRLLEPVRQYALQKLKESAEAEDISKAHAVFFLKFAEKADKGLNSPAHTAWIAQLETEHDNLRAALAWALERDEIDLGLRLAGALGEFWYMRGHLNEGRQWLEAVLAKDGSTTALARTRALARAGYIAWEQGDFERATALGEEGLALARKLGDRAGVAAALLTLGTVALYRNNCEKATALLEEALALRTIKFYDDPSVDFQQVRRLLGCPPLETAITSMTMEPWEASTKTTFRFSSNDGEATFECKLDGGTFDVCTSPKEYPGLPEGSTHTFEVRAVDSAGNTDPTPARRTWTVDTTLPKVNGTNPVNNAAGIAATTVVDAGFSEAMDQRTLTTSTFTLTKQGSSTPVSARVEYLSNPKGLLIPSSVLEANTTYTATVKGGAGGVKDLAGNPMAQDYTWTFTTAADTLDTAIGSGPSDGGYEKSTSATFSFSSPPESGTTPFECSLDGSAFASCASPKSYSSLSQGSHTFRVRAINTAGKPDPDPASRTWFVDTVVPKGTIAINGSDTSTKSQSVRLYLSASDPSPASGVALMRLSNDNSTWSEFPYSGTYDSWLLSNGAGTKTVYVQFKDNAGNVSATVSDKIKFSPPR